MTCHLILIKHHHVFLLQTVWSLQSHHNYLIKLFKYIVFILLNEFFLLNISIYQAEINKKSFKNWTYWIWSKLIWSVNIKTCIFISETVDDNWDEMRTEMKLHFWLRCVIEMKLRWNWDGMNAPLLKVCNLKVDSHFWFILFFSFYFSNTYFTINFINYVIKISTTLPFHISQSFGNKISEWWVQTSTHLKSTL